MDDLFEDLARGIHDRAKKRRNDGYVDNLPYPDLQAKPDFMNEILGGLIRDPRQNMPMAGTNNTMQLEQGNETIGSFADSLAGVRDSINSHQEEMRDTYPSLNPLNHDAPMNMGDFFIGNAPDSIKAHNENRPSKLMDDLDLMFIGLDAGTLGSTKLVRNAVKQTLKAPVEGVQQLGQLGTNIYDIGEAGVKVGGRAIKDTLDDIIPPSNGGLQPAYATPNPMNEFIKKIEDPIQTARQEPLKADIYLDDKGNNVITGTNVVAPKVMQDFGIAIDDAVKSKEQELGRELTEDETRDVYDQVTVDKFTSIEDRVKILGRKDGVLRKNGENRIVLDTLDDYEVKDLSPILQRVDRKGTGSVMANDFKDRRYGDDTWSKKTQGDGRADIAWEDAFGKSNLAEQIGEENVGKVTIKQLMPRIPRHIADSNDKREVSKWFQDIYDYNNLDKGGSMQTFATPEAWAQRKYQQRSMIPNAMIDMYKKDPNSFKFTDDEVAEELNNYLSRGIIGMVEDMPTLQKRLADLPEASAQKVMDLLTKQAKGRLARNKISKHLDNNLDLVPKTDIPAKSDIITNDLQLNGESIGDIIRSAQDKQDEILRMLTLQAQESLEEAGMLGDVYSAYQKRIGMSPAGWAKTSPGEKFRIIQSLITHNEQAIRYTTKNVDGQYADDAVEWAQGRVLPEDHPVYDIGQAYIKAIEDTDNLVINAGKGLNPDGTAGKLTVNENTVIHEGPGHHNQDLSRANPGGSRKSYEKEIDDIDVLFKHLEGNHDGKGSMQVGDRASELIGYEDYLGMKGEVGARKTADNALSGNRTLENLAEPKSAVDYKTTQTLDKDGNWVDRTTRGESGYNWGLKDDIPIGNNPSRLDYQNEERVDKILKYLHFTEEMGINNPKTLDNWLENENKSILATLKSTDNLPDLKMPESKVDSGLLGPQSTDVDYRLSHQANSDGARLDDMTGGGEYFPDDIYSDNGLKYYGDPSNLYDRQSYEIIKKARGNPEAEVTIYRAVPNEKDITAINEGDFVTLSEDYAKNHGASGYGDSGTDAGKIITKKVKVKDLRSDGNDLNEFGYFPDTDSKSLWDYPDQKYTSANTSINKTKTASAFTKLLEKDVFKKGSTNLDIGGGRFDNANDLLKDKAGAKNIVFDPFNRTKAHNAKVAKQVSGGKVDTVTINNTLNVIEEIPNQIKVLEQAKDAVKADGKVYISIYPGDKSGVGRTTAEDSFQQMKPLSDYLETVQEVFPNAKIVNGMIEATK